MQLREQGAQHQRMARLVGCAWLALLLAQSARAGPLEQRIGERVQSYCATLTDAAARRECLADLIAFRNRHGLRATVRRAADEPTTPTVSTGADPQPTPTHRPPTNAAKGGVAPATPTGTTLAQQGTLPPVQPILPLRIVQRRQVDYEQYVYRLSDGSVWEDVEGAHTRLRPNALVRIALSRLTSGHFMVTSNERRRVRALDCSVSTAERTLARCKLLREAALSF